MMTKNTHKQMKFHMITIESMVPEDHLLRKVTDRIDFSFIYELTENLYCHNNGRPSIDPVILVKYLLIGFLYGIESERRIEQEIQVNMAYRWFLGLDLDERVPDHSTISKNRKLRFQEEGFFQKLFDQLICQCMDYGLIGGKLIVTDSTHIKANTSRRSEEIMEMDYQPAEYLSILDAYEQKERKRLEESGRIPKAVPRKKQKKEPEKISRRISRTDPDAGFYKRKGKPEGMHYLSHQSLDTQSGIIVDVHTTPGNATDAASYVQRIKAVRKRLGISNFKTGADSGYDIGLVHQQLMEMEIRFYTPVNREVPQYKSCFGRRDFSYCEEDDHFQCPHGKALTLKRIQRNKNGVYREYRTERSDCQNCPNREKCLTKSAVCRRLQVNIFEKAVEKNHSWDGSPEHREALRLRQIWCEGSFATQKSQHNLRRLLRKGIKAATTHCLLSAMALNIKRMVKCLE